MWQVLTGIIGLLTAIVGLVKACSPSNTSADANVHNSKTHLNISVRNGDPVLNLSSEAGEDHIELTRHSNVEVRLDGLFLGKIYPTQSGTQTFSAKLDKGPHKYEFIVDISTRKVHYFGTCEGWIIVDHEPQLNLQPRIHFGEDPKDPSRGFPVECVLD